jgi:hypothetical protein
MQVMEIILKDIYVGERLSRETTAFQATLFIDGYRVGVITNDGQGCPNMYRPLDDKGVMLIRQAEDWCRKLPPMVLADRMSDGKPVTIPMELEIYLDNIITDWLVKMDIEKFSRKAEKKMSSAIVFGAPGKPFRLMTYGKVLKVLIHRPGFIDQLRTDIHTKVLPLLQDDEKILNTNIPWRIVERLRVPAGKWVDMAGK